MNGWCWGVHTAWKVSKYVVISGPYFPVFGLNTERDGVRYFRDKVFTDEALFTFLTEVKSIVNSRPLTAASDDISNVEAITPNHLLIGKSCPNCVFQEQDISLRKKWKELQTVKGML